MPTSRSNNDDDDWNAENGTNESSSGEETPNIIEESYEQNTNFINNNNTATTPSKSGKFYSFRYLFLYAGILLLLVGGVFAALAIVYRDATTTTDPSPLPPSTSAGSSTATAPSTVTSPPETDNDSDSSSSSSNNNNNNNTTPSPVTAPTTITPVPASGTTNTAPDTTTTAPSSDSDAETTNEDENVESDNNPSTTTGELSPECISLCSSLSCCFSDLLDCNMLYPDDTLICDDYQICSAVFDTTSSSSSSSTSTITTPAPIQEQPVLGERDIDAIAEACSTADTIDQCLFQCGPVNCCAPPLGQEGCTLGATANPTLGDINCDDYTACNILYDLPDPGTVDQICNDNDDTNSLAKCVIICRSLSCCFNDMVPCSVVATSTSMGINNIDCSNYESCSRAMDLGATDGQLPDDATTITLPDVNDVAQACGSA